MLFVILLSHATLINNVFIVDPNSSELCSYGSNTKPNSSSMVGFCFDDDKQSKSSGKRKSIHEACKQTSKIPSNDTYIELEDYNAQKDSSVESLKDKQDVRRLFDAKH